MAQNNEIQIMDVLSVSGLIRIQYQKYDSIRTLRINSVRSLAKTELENGRFDSSDSAEKTIHDACTRRLNMNISEFDNLVELWLRDGSNRLVLLRKVEWN